MSIYGYCRISTAKQSIDRQIRNIKAEYPTAHIVQEAYTGTSIFRPEWLKLYRVLKAGDTVVFDSVSRMSRNAEEGFALYEDLYHKGIRLVFLKEHHIDTETYKKALSGSIAMTGTNVDFILKGINEYLMALAKEQIKLAFEQSEKEVADLHQRTREGLLTARLNGKQVGRKKGIGFETKKSKAAKEKKRKKTIETIIRRFTTYATINSQSWDAYDPTEFPISDGQEEIAELIEQELRTIGSDKDLIVSRSDYQYVYATIPANCEGVPSIMFMAHMDCTPECAGGEITPIVHRNYDGGDIQLPAGITLSPETPQGKHLANCVGKTIITSDGYTLLGADDKTGCTILVTLIETILNDKKLKHGNLHFVFSQNEDIGRAAERFEEEYVDGQPDIVIDVDGDAPTAFSVDNFTAVGRNYTFQGKNAHPGNGFYNQYGDALTAASYFIGQLPPETHPSASKGKEGYIHCYSIEPLIDVNGEETPQNYLVKVRLRYFDAQEGDAFRQLLDEAAELTAKAFPYVVTEAEPEVMQYENVAYTMYPGLGDLIIEAAEKEGVKLTPRSERGGTTAAMLAAKGQKGGPCLYSGQQAEHSIYEWTCAEDMYQMVMVARSIIETVANQ